MLWGGREAMPESETEKPAAKCPVEMHDGSPCGRHIFYKGLCVGHSDLPDKNPDRFNREIEAMLADKNYDFTRFVFPDGADFSTWVFGGPVWFTSATFQGKVGFRATFQAEADFVGAKFQGVADFVGGTFQGAAVFFKATFQSEARFFGAKFPDGASFENSTFRRPASFQQAQFNRDAVFQFATFEGPASFHRAHFERNTCFFNTTFEGEAFFVGHEDDRLFASTDGAVADFRFARWHQAEKAVFQHVYLGKARFFQADLRKVDFTDVDWARRSGGRFAVWDELRPEGEGKKKDYALIAKLYRQLKHNYEEQRDPITAGDFHFGEMHMRRLSNPPKNALLRFLKRNLSFLVLYRWISGYGEDYILVLAWIAGVILVFALLFAYIPALALEPGPSSGASHAVAGLRPHLLYSIMCFLLRGDRPFQPAHLAGHYLSVAEGILGPPLIAMFILALNRRFKR
jgi:uncharacterized protein YjbI with pentapeptide repeats